MAAALDGLHVLVTRPSPQGEGLCKRLRAAGAQAVHLPALQIAPAQSSEALEAALQAAAEADWVIFVSGNAVRFGLSALRARNLALREDASVAVVGPASAEALIERGVAVTAQPDSGYTSEDLLRLLDGVELAGAQAVIFRGNGGRGVLAEAFTARGARVCFAEVYRRETPPFDDRQFLTWSRGAHRVVVLTSAEGTQNLLCSVTAEQRRALLEAVALVISPRLAHLARQAGFERIELAAGPMDDTILRALERLAAASVNQDR